MTVGQTVLSKSVLVGALAVTLTLTTTTTGQTQSVTNEQVVKDSLKPLSVEGRKLFAENGTLANSAAAALLLKETIGEIPGVDLNDDSFHCIIHVAKWNFERDPSGQSKFLRQNLENQNWYVFQGGPRNFLSGQAFAARRRIWGSQRVWLLYIHLNSKLAYRYTPAYVVTLTKKNPANLEALTAILGLFGLGEQELAAQENAVADYWGAEPIEMKGWSASDISVLPAVSVKQLILKADGTEGDKIDPPVVSQVKLGEAGVFDNEGRYRWDVGFGIPIRRASDLTFDSSTGVATPTNVDKTSALAMLSVYPYPVDLKSAKSQILPHLVFGVDISEKPLDEVFIGGGWGPVFANFYAGLSYVKLIEPGTDGKERDWQFTFGVLMKVRGTIDKLK